MDTCSEAAVRNNYGKLTENLIKRGLTVTSMESATAGQIASLITDTEGSSAVLKGAFVTYCNEAKIMQGVPVDVIDKYTVYSEETASAMAQACANAYCADIGIGITGTMGNIDPANPGASVPGRIYYSVFLRSGKDGGQKIFSYSDELEHQQSRLMYKLAAAQKVYEKLADILELS